MWRTWHNSQYKWVRLKWMYKLLSVVWLAYKSQSNIYMYSVVDILRFSKLYKPLFTDICLQIRVWNIVGQSFIPENDIRNGSLKKCKFYKVLFYNLSTNLTTYRMQIWQRKSKPLTTKLERHVKAFLSLDHSYHVGFSIIYDYKLFLYQQIQFHYLSNYYITIFYHLGV